MIFGPFKGTRHKLPNEIKIVWQFAELSDCTNPEKKIGCKFTPIEDEIFEEIIDLTSFQESIAFQQLGKTSKRGWPSKNTAKLKIIFTNEGVDISAHQGMTKKFWQ